MKFSVLDYVGRPVGFTIKFVSYVIMVACASCVLAMFMWLAAKDVIGIGKQESEISVTIQNDFTIDDVTSTLYEAGLINYKFLFKAFAMFTDAQEKVSAGTYTLTRGHDYSALISCMRERSPARVEVTVTLPEGFTLADMFTRFEEVGVCSSESLWETAAHYEFEFDFLASESVGDIRRLEGFLFPDTYNFYLNSSPESVLSKLLREFDAKFTEEFRMRADAMGYSINEIVTIASMIEREAANDSERGYVASVIYNRLDNPVSFPNLQIDATIMYAVGGDKGAFSTELDSPYNSYKYPGLPPTPISNPGLNSLKAALYPESTKYLYYALNKDGSHNFFETYAQHTEFVNSIDYGGN